MRRRTEKLARRSEIVNDGSLVAGIDIAKRESVVVFVRAADKARLGRLRIPTTAEGLAHLVERGGRLLGQHGCERLVLAMETTGHYWKILARTAARLGVPYVTVQSFVVARARELDDLTRDKTDQRDAGLIADLACELRFNEVQLETGAWAELRSLAEARDRYRVDQRAALQEQRALVELTWPDLLRLAPDLDGSHLQAMLRLGLSPIEVAALSRARFAAQLRGEHVGRFLPWMAGRLWAAARLARPEDQSPAASLRLQLAGQRNRAGQLAVARLDAELAAAFSQTGLGWLRGEIRGLGDALLHNLLALTGDPRRLDDARCMVKLAGTNPTERSSGEQQAAGGIHRRGRPLLRLLAHQAAVCLVRHNADFEARFLEPHGPPASTAREAGRVRRGRQQAVAHAVGDGGQWRALSQSAGERRVNVPRPGRVDPVGHRVQPATDSGASRPSQGARTWDAGQNPQPRYVETGRRRDTVRLGEPAA